MCLLITVFAAIVSTVFWYSHASGETYKTGVLCCMFWGASLMWLVDAVFGYAEEGSVFFLQSSEELLHEAMLGLSVVALALTVWLIILLIKDPKGVFKKIMK